MLLDSISNTSLGPPATSRAAGMVATAMFDAWAAYDAVAVGTELGGTLRRPSVERTTANKEIAVSYAAYRVLLDIYPSRSAQLRQAMADRGLDPDNASTDTTTPVGIGNTVAAALLASRHNDGSNQLGNLNPGAYSDWTGYVPVNTVDTLNDPSQWQPLRFANGAAPGFIAPHWGHVRPFAVANVNTFLMGGPPAFGSTECLKQLQEVIDQTALLTDREKAIAEYWANGPNSVLPPGHWMEFGEWISERDHHSLDDDVKMYFMIGNAVMDAGIVCWNNKRTYNSARPITAIRYFFADQMLPSYDQATQKIILKPGSQWHPYQSANFITPPFPEYSSGHSTFSAAAAEVLTRFTGSSRFGMTVEIPKASLVFEPNVPAKDITLAWNTFEEAAQEAGRSRIYGGIHIRAGNESGLQCGKDIGALVYQKAMTYIDGTATSNN